MKFIKRFIPMMIILFSLLTTSCSASATEEVKNQPQAAAKKIVVTYTILGSVVKELVGNQAVVITLIPNGLDIHTWEPSAKDIEALMKADLIVQNGLDLEASVIKTIQQAKKNGVKVFTAAHHITIRKVGEGESAEEVHHHEVGAEDPHLWTDPLAMKAIVEALSQQLKMDLNIDVSYALTKQLDALNDEVEQNVESIPKNQRKLVTGHESMGYYAQRYGFQLVGAIIPSLTTQAEVSAADLAALKSVIQESQVKAIFTELGTPKQVIDLISQETKVKVVELNTHILPEDSSYFTFIRNLTQTIVDGLK